MYVRMNSLSVIRGGGRKLYRISTLVALMICALFFLFLFTLIQSDHHAIPATQIFNREETRTANPYPMTGSKIVANLSVSTTTKQPWTDRLLGFLRSSRKQRVDKVSKKESSKRLSELSTWNSNQSVMLEDYLDLSDLSSFIHQPHASNVTLTFCGPDVQVLILVTSAASNLKSRMAIRNTWGSNQNLLEKGGRMLFILGTTPNSTVNESVAKEAEDFGDMIVENFYDTYHNLTLKSMAILKWVNLTCPQINDYGKPDYFYYPKHILKTDDDMFINFDRLLKIIHDMPNSKMIGRLTCGAAPIPDPSSKLYMPKYLYPEKTYPGYLSGTAYVLRSDIIPTLLQNAKTVPLVHLEDIYVTSLIARASKIYPDDSAFFTYNHLLPKDSCAFRFMVNSHQMTPQEMEFVYNDLKKPLAVPCTLRKAKWLRKVPRLTKRLRTLCKFS